MEHHQGARGFLHCSTTAVYKPMGHHVFAEDDELGDNHGVWPFLRTYSICKIAAEATARWAARRFELPTTIARLSVPYGDRGGWPAVHLEMMINTTPSRSTPTRPASTTRSTRTTSSAWSRALLGAASVPATVVNWGGDEAVSIEEWCDYLAELTGLPAIFAPTSHTIDSVDIDLDKMHALIGPTTVAWRDGLVRMVAARHPELLR